MRIQQNKQVCIPVGCVPPASLVCWGGGGLCPGGSLSEESLVRRVSVYVGRCPGGGSLFKGGLCPGGLCLGVSVRGGVVQGLSAQGVSVTETYTPPSPVDRMTHTCVNSTVRFAGGNQKKWLPAINMNRYVRLLVT